MPVLQWRQGKAHAGVGDGIAPVFATPGGSHAFLLQVKDDPLGLPIAVVNDLLRMKAVTPSGSVLDNWLKVTGRDTSPTGYTNYTVVRQSGTPGTFPAGQAVVNFGQSGQGFLFLTSDDADGPYYSVRTHTGTPWVSTTEVGRFGNLKNSFGVGASNRYGFAAGDYAGGNYVLYNPTDGFVLKSVNGNITMDGTSIRLIGSSTGSLAAPNSINFVKTVADGGATLAQLYGWYSGSTSAGAGLDVGSGLGAAANAYLRALADPGSLSNAYVVASNNTFLVAGNTSASLTSELVAYDAIAGTTRFNASVATQRNAVFEQPTYSAVSARTITTAATLAVAGAPITGSNMTLTKALAVWVQGGNSEFDGDLTATGGLNVGTATGALTGQAQVTGANASAYAARLLNTSATGHGLLVNGGSTSSQFALTVQTNNGGTNLFLVKGDGSISVPSGSLDLATGVLTHAGTQVVGARTTGWSTATNTLTRTTFDTTTVTLAVLAAHVGALINDLINNHGLIGA